jgi:hypothetical protein
MTAAGGLFLLLWYRTLVSLPVARQPGVIHPAAFKWGVPLAGGFLGLLGTIMLAAVRPLLAVAGLALGALAGYALLRFDRYTADMRRTHERYRRIRAANPGMSELETLFHTAEARYPTWSHDRLVELVAGKDIAGLMLLMLIKDNDIHPISDWELYRSLRSRAESLAGVLPAEGERG